MALEAAARLLAQALKGSLPSAMAVAGQLDAAMEPLVVRSVVVGVVWYVQDAAASAAASGSGLPTIRIASTAARHATGHCHHLKRTPLPIPL